MASTTSRTACGRHHGIELATEHEHRTPCCGEPVAQVHRLRLAGEEMTHQLRVHHRSDHHVGIDRLGGVQRDAVLEKRRHHADVAAEELSGGGAGILAPETARSSVPPRRDRGGRWCKQALPCSGGPDGGPGNAGRRSPQTTRQRRPAARCQRLTQAHDVIGPRIERPLIGCTSVATPVAPVVVEHDLGDVVQHHRVGALVHRVVEARTAVQHEHRGPFDHGWSSRNQAGSVHVDEQSHATIDRNSHDRTLRRPEPRPRLEVTRRAGAVIDAGDVGMGLHPPGRAP